MNSKYYLMNKVLEEQEKEGFFNKEKEESESWADHLVYMGCKEAEERALELERMDA